MKTLLFTLEYPPFKGGVANVYGNIVKYWPDKDNIFVLDNNDNKLINNKLPFLKWLPAVWQLWRTIQPKKSPQPPLLKEENNIGHILVGQILPLGTAAYIISKFLKIKYSVILHGMDFTFALKSAHKKWLAGKILKNSENIICMNSFTAELVKKFIGGKEPGKIKIVNPGVASELRITNYELRMKFIKKYNLENKLVLLMVGRLVKRKGVDMVLKVLPEVLKEIPDLVYVIVGRGEELTNYKLQITNYKLQNNVAIITDADDEEKNIWYDICDIFIMPSRVIKRATTNGAHTNNNISGIDFEGFGVVYLEANLAGKPVIAGDSGGVKDAVENGLNGLLVDPNNTSDIAYAIIKLAKDENLRKKLGERGRGRAVREFNWERQTRKIYNLITRNT